MNFSLVYFLYSCKSNYSLGIKKVFCICVLNNLIYFCFEKFIDMKKLVLLMVLMLTSVVFAQKGAKIEFKAKDNTIDYGSVNKDVDNGLRTFEFTNTGDAPLVINDVKSSCGCTVPTKPTEPILPGKTGIIEVKYSMNPGPINKTITVDCNAVNVDSGKVLLKIKGTVVVVEPVNLLEKKKSIMGN
jgi:Protein of unknown function (DUF1573)